MADLAKEECEEAARPGTKCLETVIVPFFFFSGVWQHIGIIKKLLLPTVYIYIQHTVVAS